MEYLFKTREKWGRAAYSANHPVLLYVSLHGIYALIYVYNT